MARNDRQSPQGSDRTAGTPSGANNDPTTMTGQYGPPLVGGFAVPAGSGAGGSPGQGAGEPESVNQPGQVPTQIFGVATGLAGTGAPGSAGRSAGDGFNETPGARSTDIGTVIYGQSVADHALAPDDVPRYNGDYPPEHGKQIPSLNMPVGTGAPGSSGNGPDNGAAGRGGSGSGAAVRPTGKSGNFGVPHPNQGR